MSDLPITQRKCDDEIAALKARVAELEGVLRQVMFHDNRYGWFPDKFYEEVKSLLAKTPKQSLADIKAAAIREFLPEIKAMDEPAYIKGRFASEMFWRGAFAAQDLATKHANQLQAED